MEAICWRRRGERIASLTEKVSVIVNPASGRGRGAKLLSAVREAFAWRGVTQFVTTTGSKDERRLALEAMSAGATTIVCVGGDGTAGNIANTILHSGSDVRLGIVPTGTGNDFARMLGVTRADINMIAARSIIPSQERIDVGRIEENYFLNSTGFGFDVAVLQGLVEARWLGNNLVYFYSALTGILGFRGVEMKIESPNSARERTLYLLVVIANGSRFGGGLRIAPAATATDGELDLVLIRDASRLRRLQMLASATSGGHVQFGEVTVEQASRMTFRFDEKPFYESDGELHQAASSELTVECFPAALRVLTREGWNNPEASPRT
ncbi:MAG: diacylglycerol kinase family protein [Gemmatimonadaceae bacterium]